MGRVALVDLVTFRPIVGRVAVVGGELVERRRNVLGPLRYRLAGCSREWAVGFAVGRLWDYHLRLGRRVVRIDPEDDAAMFEGIRDHVAGPSLPRGGLSVPNRDQDLAGVDHFATDAEISFVAKILLAFF